MTQPLIGIAKLAADSAPIEERNDVDYRAIDCRSCLNRQRNLSRGDTPLVPPGPRLPFRFTINPYRGCEFGCAYCYARYTHEFMELRDWRDFERKIFVKEEAPERLARELTSAAVRREPIAIGTATDPYQPAERRYGLTRRLLEVLLRHRGLDLSITTKSDLVARDADLIRRIGERSAIQVNVTVTTTDRDLARKLEPRAPTPEKRLAAVAKLVEAGIVAGVFCAPILPFITDGEEHIEAVFRAAREAGARYVMTNVLFLMDSAKKRYLPFIDEAFPEVAPRFRALYGASPYAPERYREGVLAVVEKLRARYGLPPWVQAPNPGGGPAEPRAQATFAWEAPTKKASPPTR